MSDKPGIRNRWKTVVTEFVTIVIGILVALAADAWWQNRADRRDEREALASLMTEFSASRLVLQERLARHEEIRRSLSTILEWVAPEPDLPSDSTVTEELWVGIGGWVTYEDRRGVLDGLIASGRLSLIRDASLQAMLAGWGAEVADLAEDELAAVRDLDERLKPRWYALSPLGEGAFSPTYDRLLSDPVFEHLLLERLDRTEAVLSEYNDVLEAVEAILSALDGNLNSK